MAKHGIKGMIGGGVAEGGAMHRVMEAYRDANVRAGRDLELGERTFRSASTSTSPTPRKRRSRPPPASTTKRTSRCSAHSVSCVRSATSRSMRCPTPSALRPADLPRIEDAVKTGGFLAGPPEQIIEQLKKVEAAYPGLDRVGVSHPVGTPQAVILEQMEMFAEEVMPAFSGRAVEAVPAD